MRTARFKIATEELITKQCECGGPLDYKIFKQQPTPQRIQQFRRIPEKSEND